MASATLRLLRRYLSKCLVPWVGVEKTRESSGFRFPLLPDDNKSTLGT